MTIKQHVIAYRTTRGHVTDSTSVRRTDDDHDKAAFYFIHKNEKYSKSNSFDMYNAAIMI